MKSVLPIIAASLSGCAMFSGVPHSGERRVDYICNYGSDLTVIFAGNAARIESKDGSVTLQQRQSASGFWYESATHSLKGSLARVTYRDRQMAPRECRAAR